MCCDVGSDDEVCEDGEWNIVIEILVVYDVENDVFV